MPCLLYRPVEAQAGSGYLHIHGGGYVAGSVEGSDAMNTRIAAQLGVVVLTVGYRLAPEHPVPAPLDDCYAALGWLHEQADALGIDRQRIAIGGESAGGGLAAALAIHARDLGEFAICHQHLTYPMLDDRTGTEAAPGDPLVGEFVWNRRCNEFGWQCYLGKLPAQAPFVPARVASVEGTAAYLDVYGWFGSVSGRKYRLRAAIDGRRHRDRVGGAAGGLSRISVGARQPADPALHRQPLAGPRRSRKPRVRRSRKPRVSSRWRARHEAFGIALR